jgi:hypothetical protein
MKSNRLIQVLCGAGLALQLCENSAAQPSIGITICASDFSVYGDQQNKQQFNSTFPNFSAGGSAMNPYDGSSASGAQTIAYAGGIFTGSGRITEIAGNSQGVSSTTADGETSVFITFVVTNAFHYQFESSVSTRDNVRGNVLFNGLNTLNNSGGTVTASGTLDPNQYTLRAYMTMGTNLGPGSGTWSYSLSLVPANIPPGRFTTDQNLGNSANWTTIFSNTVTMPLLSFTNGSSESVKAGCFWASHN